MRGKDWKGINLAPDTQKLIEEVREVIWKRLGVRLKDQDLLRVVFTYYLKGGDK